MLKKLKIQNLAIAESIEISFSETFNIITGESGAGKTIIYKSISYLFGNRFSKQDIRKGKSECSIEGILLVNKKEFKVRRTFTKTSSKSYIDDKVVKLSDYIEFVQNSWESYGQHEQQLLMDSNNHISYLDSFSKTEDLYKQYLDLFLDYQNMSNEILLLRKEANDFIRNQELYEFQYDELSQLDIQLDEDIQLQAKISTVKKNKDIHETLYKLANLNSSSSNTIKIINDSVDLMNDLPEDIQGAETAANRLNEFLNEFEDIKFESSKLIQNFYYNQSEIDDMNRRLIAINELKRKYGGTISSTIQHREKLKMLIDNSNDIDSLIKEKIASKDKLETKLENCGSNLYKIRKKSSFLLADKIKSDLSGMGMPSINFHIELGSMALNKIGLEECVFYIKTNKGEELKTLGEIVSGGELSRIMMSIKLSINLHSKGKIFVLDEIDAGLSGKEADSIGRVIEKLSIENQVICITHLSQIASKAENHYKVYKEIVNHRTECSVLLLDEKTKVNELAAMVSGKEVTAESIDYAKGILRK